jgi:hypothetical protein
MRHLAAAALALVATACADAGTTDQARCDRACERDTKCNMGTGSPFCDTDCVDRLSALLPEFRVAYLDCSADTTCADDPQADCEVLASQEVEQRQLDTNFQTECQAVQGNCEEAFSSDFCFVTRYYEETAVVAAMDCLGMPCGEVDACLRLQLPLAPFE